MNPGQSLIRGARDACRGQFDIGQGPMDADPATACPAAAPTMPVAAKEVLLADHCMTCGRASRRGPGAFRAPPRRGLLRWAFKTGPHLLPAALLQ